MPRITKERVKSKESAKTPRKITTRRRIRIRKQRVEDAPQRRTRLRKAVKLFQSTRRTLPTRKLGV
jgi:hypothetical protein